MPEPKIHVFISDLHLTDDPSGNPTLDDELLEFAERLHGLSERHKPLRLVLVGDVVDLLRSNRWSDLAEAKGSYPWKGVQRKFASFAKGHAETCAIEVVKGIRRRYRGFEARLKELREQGRVEVDYVIGNHDYMAQLSTDLRRELCGFLSLNQSPEKPFPGSYENSDASVLATHGHAYDPVNLHDREAGRWAFGDAIVLRIVNHFAHAARVELGATLGTEFGQRLEDIDNVEPHSDVPLFVLWLAESLAAGSDRRALLDVWNRTVADFLANDTFHPPRRWLGLRKRSAYETFDFGKLRAVLKISTKHDVAKLGAYLSRYLPVDDYRKHAATLVRQVERFRFVVMGHTHTPVMVPLDHTVNGAPAYYVNTGCWKKVVCRPNRHDSGPFISQRTACYFVIDSTHPTRPHHFVLEHYAT